MRCAIYIRKSREELDKSSHRLTAQREQLPSFAKKQGWDIETYDDGHASAARGKIEDLSERSRLENDIRKGKVDIVLVIELSRLSRDDTLQDYVAWLTLCSEQQVKLATMSRILDPSHHSDWMLLLMEGGFSSVEMKVLQSRMKEGRRQAFLDGKWLGGTPPSPYFYDKAAGRLAINSIQLEKLKKIWKLAETESARAIALKFKMPEITVRRAISDDRLLVYQALRYDLETDSLIKCDWQPVMSADQANKVQAGRRTRKTNGKARKAAALLSNLDLLRCGYCGRTVKTWRNSKYRKDGERLNYYGCQVKNSKGACPRSRLIPQTVLNERVLKNIFNTIELLDSLKHYWFAEQQRQTESDKVLKELETKEKKLKNQKLNLVNAISQGIIELIDAKEKMIHIKKELNDIESERTKIVAKNQIVEPDWEELKLTWEDFAMLNFEDQRLFISAALNSIKIYQNYALLVYNFPRASNGDRCARIHIPIPQRGNRHKECFVNCINTC